MTERIDADLAVLREQVRTMRAGLRDVTRRVDLLEEVNAERRGQEEERARVDLAKASPEKGGRKVSVNTMVLAVLSAVAALPPIIEKLGELL